MGAQRWLCVVHASAVRVQHVRCQCGASAAALRCAALPVRSVSACSACVVRICSVRAVRARRTFFAFVQSAHRTLAWKPLAAKAVCSRTVKVKPPLQSLHTICWSCCVSAFRLDMCAAS